MIVKFHFLSKAVLIILIPGPNSRVEFLEPVLDCGEGCWSVIHDGNGVHPCCEVFLASLFNERVAVNLDKIASLGHVDTVNSLTTKSVPAGTKLILFGRYVLNIYVGIV
jgi:hypothetical protein